MIHINDAWDSSICQLKLTNLWKPARLDNSAAFIELSRPHPVRGEGISPIEAAFLIPIPIALPIWPQVISGITIVSSERRML